MPRFAVIAESPSPLSGVGSSSVFDGAANKGAPGPDGPAPAGPQAGESLPCQSSNNSTDTSPKLSPYQRKNAYILKENLDAMIEKFGVSNVGMLTLTFPRHLSLKEANRRFNSLASNFLGKHFPAWVCVREFTKTGRPHFHLIVATLVDIRDGFAFPVYVQMVRINRKRRKTLEDKATARALARQLNPSPGLRSLWNALRAVLPKYGFGRHELLPIRKSGPALAYYVGGYIRKSMEMRPASAKGARLITYSKDFERRVSSHAFQWNTARTRVWRLKVKRFAEIHGIKDFSGLSSRFGPRWAWWFKDVIQSLNVWTGQQSTAVTRDIFDCSDLEAVESAFERHGSDARRLLHLTEPKLPEVDGKPAIPPLPLRSTFAFHLGNRSAFADQVITPAQARRMPSSPSPSRLVNYTHEQMEAARRSVLAPTSAPSLVDWTPDELSDPWWREFIPQQQRNEYETTN